MATVLCLSDLWPPFPGGAERLMFNLARHLQHAGHDVHVLTGYEAARQHDGPPVHVAPIGVFDERDAGAAIVRQALVDLQPDVILAHHLYAYEFELELLASGIPLVHVVLNGHRIEGASLAVFISEWVARQADRQPHDLVITPPVFDDVIAAEHGSAIGFVKPLPHKGIDLLYRIARLLPRRRFVVLRGEWQTLEVIRPARNITFLEPVVDMRDFWAKCRMVLMPSLSEDAGTVAQEATVNGLPCISSDVGGLAETNGGGVLLAPMDAHRWVTAIKELDDPARYRMVVDRQTTHLAATDQTGRLDELAARITTLAVREEEPVA